MKSRYFEAWAASRERARASGVIARESREPRALTPNDQPGRDRSLAESLHESRHPSWNGPDPTAVLRPKSPQRLRQTTDRINTANHLPIHLSVLSPTLSHVSSPRALCIRFELIVTVFHSLPHPHDFWRFNGNFPRLSPDDSKRTNRPALSGIPLCLVSCLGLVWTRLA